MLVPRMPGNFIENQPCARTSGGSASPITAWTVSTHVRTERSELAAAGKARTRRSPSDAWAPRSKTVIHAVREVISTMLSSCRAKRQRTNGGAVDRYRVKQIFWGTPRSVFPGAGLGRPRHSWIRVAAEPIPIAVAWCLACGIFS